MFGRLIVFESFAIVHEITRRIRVSANLTSERECREREREKERGGGGGGDLRCQGNIWPFHIRRTMSFVSSFVSGSQLLPPSRAKRIPGGKLPAKR